jgi:hypothetical protein
MSSIILFVPLTVIFDFKSYIMVFIFFSCMPDLDLMFKKKVFRHRNILFHSVIFPALMFFDITDEISVTFKLMIMMAVGVHLLGDIKFRDKNGNRPGGTYCVTRLNWKKTTWWLFLNGIIPIIIFTIYINWGL